MPFRESPQSPVCRCLRFSRAKEEGLRGLPDVTLPNSFMSAPATKVLPPPISTTALTLASLAIWSNASKMPSGTPGLRVFTAGLLIVMMAMSLCFVSCTKSARARLSDVRTVKSARSSCSNKETERAVKPSPFFCSHCLMRGPREARPCVRSARAHQALCVVGCSPDPHQRHQERQNRWCR
jgi:hypothetical protein